MTHDTSSSQAPEVTGTAQSPRTLPWAPNRDGPRTDEEAVALARRWGVVIPEDIHFVFRDELVPEDAYAKYTTVESRGRIMWSYFYAKGEIPVKVRRSVLESDEAIVAVIAHEMFELNALREMFEERETIPSIEIISLIRTGVPKNLHDRAWDAADRIVRTMRQEGSC